MTFAELSKWLTDNEEMYFKRRLHIVRAWCEDESPPEWSGNFNTVPVSLGDAAVQFSSGTIMSLKPEAPAEQPAE